MTDENDNNRLRHMLWTIAFMAVIYTASMGPAFRYARRSSFPYYQPVIWLVHEAPELPQPCPQVRDAYCAYLNWCADL